MATQDRDPHSDESSRVEPDVTLGREAEETNWGGPSRQQGRTSRRPVDDHGMAGAGASAERYDRVGELGRGGCGIVERVIDLHLEREVAVKRVVADGTNAAEARRQFLHEAKITSQLQHPGVVPVHELSDGKGDAYYVMKLLEGDTLRAHIRQVHQRGPARWTTHELRESITPLLERFVDICHAVAYAHEQGIVHRDLKSANVMAGEFGETIVVDWGLAIRSDQDPDESAESRMAIVGTPAYMSPEQARGEPPVCSADIYSLGSILYEITSGQHPYVGSSVTEVLRRVREGDRPPVSLIQPATPKALAAIIQRATENEPQDRYATATDLARDVRHFISGDAVSAFDETILDRASRWCRRHRASAVTIAISAVVLLIASAAFGVVIHRAHRAERQARREAQSAHHEALQRLIEARDAADSWLIELSGALEFYPGMRPIHNEMIGQAITQYERLIGQPPVSSGADAGPREKSLTSRLSNLERAKCFLRLGDLYRIRGDLARSETAINQAAAILHALGGDSYHVRVVSSSPQASAEVASGLSLAEVADGETQVWQSHRRQARLEWVNASIGRLLIHSDDASHQVPSHRRWLAAWLPDEVTMVSQIESSPTLQPLSKFVARVASAAVRLELAAHRCRSVGTDQLGRAVTVGRWLAVARGNEADLRLSEATQTEWAEWKTSCGDEEAALQAWTVLIDDLATWSAGQESRPDQLQSLAHARIRRAALHARLDQVRHSIQDNRQAIHELEAAWRRSDSDGYFRVNLATAETNLGQLVFAADPDDSLAREEALQLLRGALSTYEELLQENVTPELLRRIAQAHAVLGEVRGPSGGRHGDMSDAARHVHYESALLAYQTLEDRGHAKSGDRLHRLELLLRHAGWLQRGGHSERGDVMLSQAREVEASLGDQPMSKRQEEKLRQLRQQLP